MNSIHPDDTVKSISVVVTLGDGRTGTCLVDHQLLGYFTLPGPGKQLMQERLYLCMKAAEHAANPKGPRLPPELERVVP